MNFRFILLLFLASCSTLPEQDAMEEWTPSAFQARIDQGDAVLVDLRTPSETATGTLPGAVEVDFWSPAFERFLQKSDKFRVYLIYCAHGVRGREAVLRMRGSGIPGSP